MTTTIILYRRLLVSTLLIMLNLNKSVESQKSTQGFDAPRKFKNTLFTNQVTTVFLNSLCTSIPYKSFLCLT